MIRDLKGVVDRERAPIGVFLTLAEPTRPMEKEAAAAGFYTLGDRQYPRVQIITVGQALLGQKPAIPLVDTGAAFKRAARERTGTRAGWTCNGDDGRLRINAGTPEVSGRHAPPDGACSA